MKLYNSIRYKAKNKSEKRDKARGAARGPARALRGEFFIRYKKPKAWGEGRGAGGLTFVFLK